MSSAEVSPNIDSLLAIDLMTVALIGPDEEKRRALATALGETHRTSVREFDSYPPDMDRWQSLLSSFDVVMLDGDGDPNKVLSFVEKANDGSPSTVMVYSEHSDPNVAVRYMRAGACEFIPMPLEHGIMDEALNRSQEILNQKTSRKPMGKLLVFVGAKGGSGVTTVASNVAIALAQGTQQSTLLIDLALPIGDAALGLGMTPDFSTEDALRNIDRLDSSLLQKLLAKHKSGISVLAAPSEVSEIEISKESIDKMVSVARREFDHVVVDVGSRIDVAAKALFRNATTIYLVTQTGISELRNSNRLIAQFFDQVGPRLEVVINKFEPRMFDAVNEDVVVKALGRPVQWKIPEDQEAARALQNGELGSTETRVSRTADEIAGVVTGRAVPEKKKGFVRSISRSIAEVASSGDDLPKLSIVAPTAQRQAPAIKWSAPEPISYGIPLSSAQLNAKATVPGVFSYTPGPGYVLPPGTHTLWVTFTPSEDEVGSPLQTAVSIVVAKSRPVVKWTAPPPITYGTPLDETQLNALASVPGTFEYSPGAGDLVPAGTHSLSVRFIPDDSECYNTAEATVAFTVVKATPIIQWEVPEAVQCKTVLGPEQLNAISNVPGSFEYSPAEGKVLLAGTHKLAVTFTPSDTANYHSATAAVTITATMPKPILEWPHPEPVTYGTRLSAKQLCAAQSWVPGKFEYTPDAGALLAAGEHTLSVFFTPDDNLGYASTRAAVTLTVAKATPPVEWPTPDPVASGTALSATQLNATAKLPGTFTYLPAAGEVLKAGVHTLTATFTPYDSVNYATVHSVVSLTVTEKAPVSIEWPEPETIEYGAALSATQLNAKASVSGTFVYSPSEGHVLAPGQHTLSMEFTPSDIKKYAIARAEVSIEVTPLPDIASLLAAASPKPSTSKPTIKKSGHAKTVTVEAPHRSTTAIKPRETRTYKGAVYEKGEDGQWHLQQK